MAVGTKFFLDSISTGSDPSLKYGGADVVAGQFSGWTPIGAEQTASGYQVAWKVPGADQYSVWTTDSNGNFISSSAILSASSSALQSFETSFHQDLNGDGAIGVPGTVIESAGSTSLVAVRDQFFLDSISTGSDPSLKYGGADVVAGQFGGWTPIGAEQTASGYQVAWKVPGADQYSVWTTDSNGNFISTSAILSASSSALQSFETSFHQDLNGDGAIGVPEGWSWPARPWTAPTSAVERPCLILDLRGMSKRLLISTATASPTSCGSTTTGRRRSGSWTAPTSAVEQPCPILDPPGISPRRLISTATATPIFFRSTTAARRRS